MTSKCLHFSSARSAAAESYYQRRSAWFFVEYYSAKLIHTLQSVITC